MDMGGKRGGMGRKEARLPATRDTRPTRAEDGSPFDGAIEDGVRETAKDRRAVGLLGGADSSLRAPS